MNRPEAYEIVSAVLERYRNLDPKVLRSKIGTTTSEDLMGSAGIHYTVDVTIDWSDSQQRGFVIRTRIDDQNTFQFAPLEEKIYVALTEDP